MAPPHIEEQIQTHMRSIRSAFEQGHAIHICFTRTDTNERLILDAVPDGDKVWMLRSAGLVVLETTYVESSEVTLRCLQIIRAAFDAEYKEKLIRRTKARGAN